MAAIELSFSQVEEYRECPRRYHLARKPAPELVGHGYDVAFGLALHRMAASYYSPERPRRESAAAWLDRARRRLREEVGAMAFPDPATRAHYEVTADRVAERFARREEALRPPPLRVEVEVPFRIQVGAVPVAGRIDRIDHLPGGPVNLLDYKWEHLPPAEPVVEASLQLRLYQLALRGRGLEVAGAGIYDLLSARVVMSPPATAEELESARREVEAVAAAIARGDFPARRNPGCGKCPFRLGCPAWP
ncbi:MAG: RecB family exonuclease [Candidatus Dormibacteria bacterium]